MPRKRRIDELPGTVQSRSVIELCYESINRSPFIEEQNADLPAQITGAAAAGFTCIGLDAPSLSQHCEQGGSLEELARTLDALGLRCFEIQPLVVGDDPRKNQEQAELIAGMVEILRPDWVQSGFTGAPDAESLAAFRQAGEIIGQAGAGLAVEYLPFLPLCSIETTRELLNRAEVEGAGIVVDTWHFFFGPDRWEDLEALPLNELAYVQFDDHPPLVGEDLMEETTQRRVLPGQGTFDLSRFCDVVLAKGYTSPVSVEILSESLRTLEPSEFARLVYDATRPFWPGD